MREFRYTGGHPTRTLGHDFDPGRWVAVSDTAAAKLAGNRFFEERPPAGPRAARKAVATGKAAVRRSGEG